MTVRSVLRKFITNEEGATAIEYGLIAALISVAAIAAMTALGTSLNSMFSAVSDALNGAEQQIDSPGAGTPTA